MASMWSVLGPDIMRVRRWHLDPTRFHFGAERTAVAYGLQCYDLYVHFIRRKRLCFMIFFFKFVFETSFTDPQTKKRIYSWLERNSDFTTCKLCVKEMRSQYWMGDSNGMGKVCPAAVKWVNPRPEHSPCSRAEGHQCAEPEFIKFRPVDTLNGWMDGIRAIFITTPNCMLDGGGVWSHTGCPTGWWRRILATLPYCNEK